MSQYRDKSPWRRILSWKRLLLFSCICVLLFMIVRTPGPMKGPEKSQKQILEPKWDEDTIKLFKKQLSLDTTALEQELDPSYCSNLWEENADFLIVTGFPGLNEDDLESYLWMYFNFLALEKSDRTFSPNLRLLLPSKAKQALEKVFENVAFGDLSILVQCEKHVKIDELLQQSRVVGHFEEIFFEESSKESVKQLIILNAGAKRLKELADFDFSFVPYRPLFTQNIVRKVRWLMGRGNVPVGDYSVEEGEPPAIADTVPLNFIGVYVGQRDNFPGLVERIKAAMNYHRNAQVDVFFIVLCDEFYKYDCMSNFDADDTVVTGFDTRVEERFAVLSVCHGNIVSNGIGFFGALMSNGDVSLVNFERSGGWPMVFAEKKEDWMIIEEGATEAW